MKSDFDGKKAEIHYPCQWSYQVIGLDEILLREAVASVIGSVPYTLGPGHTSSGGKYRSLALEAKVESEEERLRVFDLLSKHPAIRFVL